MNEARQKLTQYRPATYQIKVPGHLDERWTEWDGKMAVENGMADDGTPVATLTGAVDQAALHSLLRRLYSLGLPLISVICLNLGQEAGPGGAPN
jgi:hypothetical protein